MQPLATTRLLMTWLSMCLADESSTERQKRAYVAHASVVLSFNLIALLASLAFCVNYIEIDFDGAIFAFMVAVGVLGMVYFMIAAILMRHKIGHIFTSLTTIYESNENQISFRYLIRANDTSEWMWTIYTKYVAVSVVGTAIICSLSVIYCYLIRGDFNVDYFYRPGKFVYAMDLLQKQQFHKFSSGEFGGNFSFPWNQTTAIGYFGEAIISILITYGYLILNGTSLLLFISLCLHHQAFYKMFKHKIDESKKCDADLLKDLIRFHISAKDLFLDSANVYSQFVLVQLICCSVLMTISVFYLDLQWHQFGFTVFTVLVTSSIGISNLFLYCYFGKWASESYEMMSDCLYDMEWYEQPKELQKHFILMTANMQIPVYYHGFYMANLDLLTFTKLCKSVFSYYMMFKTLAAK